MIQKIVNLESRLQHLNRSSQSGLCFRKATSQLLIPGERRDHSFAVARRRHRRKLKGRGVEENKPVGTYVIAELRRLFLIRTES